MPSSPCTPASQIKQLGLTEAVRPASDCGWNACSAAVTQCLETFPLLGSCLSQGAVEDATHLKSHFLKREDVFFCPVICLLSFPLSVFINKEKQAGQKRGQELNCWWPPGKHTL